MSCPCDICQKTFSSLRNLRRHRKAIHNIKTQNKPLQCNECNFESPSLVGMIHHTKQLHGSETIHHGVYCSKTFLLKSVFEDHMKLNHGMPQWRNNGYSGDLPVMSSISGNLRSIQLHTSGNENDMLEYLMNQKHEIQQIVRSETEAGPKKIQFAAKIKMLKDVSEQEEPEHFDFFINSEMTIVYPGENLTDEMFWNKVEQIINSISTLTTNGSGWRFEKLLSFEIKLSRFSPIRAGSYIALPVKYQSEQSLLNIRNYGDPNCFLYCYTAAFHLFYGPPLVNEDTTWRTKRSPSLYGPKNPRAHQPYGNHQMPMPVDEIGIFENENDVQINVFR